MDSKPPGEIQYSKAAIFGRTCWNLRNTWIFVLAPIILLPLPIAVPNQEAKCGYVILLMLVYYLTEVIPIAVVALTPLVLLPLFEIIPPKALSQLYMREVNITYLGSMMVALSIQHWGIPKRLALWVLIQVGTDIRRLLFAIMSTTTFLSLFINNAPTAIMMLPIARSVATEYFKEFSMEKTSDKSETHANGEVIVNMQLQEINPDNMEEDPVKEGPSEEKAVNADTEENIEDMSREKKNILKLFILSVPWCSNIGGAGSLYGTALNVIIKANLESAFKDPTSITFVNWMAFSLPCSIIIMVFGWALLITYHLGWRSLFVCRRKTPENLQRESNLNFVFKNQYRTLGPTRYPLRSHIGWVKPRHIITSIWARIPYLSTFMSPVFSGCVLLYGVFCFAEYAAVGHMATLALVWITMEPGFFTGWGSFLSKGYVSAYPPAILLTVSTFIFPSRFPDFLRFWDKKKMIAPHKPSPPLMDWKTVNKLLPWNTLLMIGGGMAVAEASKVSGLSVWIADSMGALSDLPPYVICIITVTVSVFATEIMGGGALLAILHPVLAVLAVRVHVHPLYFMFPVSVGTVYAFMLPTASPINTIGYSSGIFTIGDMAKPGIIMNVMTIVVITMAANTWGAAVFQLDTFPSWANDTAL